MSKIQMMISFDTALAQSCQRNYMYLVYVSNGWTQSI